MMKSRFFVFVSVRGTVEFRVSRLDDGTGVRGDTRPEVGALLGDGTGDGGSLHFTLRVDYHTAVSKIP